jgi:hypothetical protein
MPAFKDRRTDEPILAIIAFVKRGWPIGLRASQATLNPGYAGMPPEASRVAWKLPPTCRAALDLKSPLEGFGDRPGTARRDPALAHISPRPKKGLASSREGARSPKPAIKPGLGDNGLAFLSP